MNKCPITFEPCGEAKYSERGLRALHPRLKDLTDFPLGAEEQRRTAVSREARISISGVQPKLSAQLSVKKGTFEVTAQGGHFILKPQLREYPEVPQNESLTMKMAAACGIEVPLSGMVWAVDGSLLYFVKRFDRVGSGKLAVEDFTQLLAVRRGDKYGLTVESMIAALDFCTFPVLAKQAFFKRVLFNYLVGNEDAHLKNWSLLTKRDGVVELSPAYDLLNTAILTNSGKEAALMLRGRDKNYRQEDFMGYLAERLGLTSGQVKTVLEELVSAQDEWEALLDKSFLGEPLKKNYHAYLSERRRRVLGI